MNVQFLGKLHLTDNNGNPAVGYQIWPYSPGSTTTPADSYSDPDCTVLNAWPVVMDVRGEAAIYCNFKTDFYYTIPTATDVSSPIWGPITIGQQEGVAPLLATVAAGTTNNNYVAAVVPPVLSLINEQMIIMTPDSDNLATLGTTSFTGSGINDLIYSGPYVGTVVGAIFRTKIDKQYAQPPIAPAAVLSATAGTVTTGVHYVALTILTADGETTLGNPSALVTGDSAHKIDVSGIPAIAGAITGYKVYMTKAGGTTYYYVATVTTTTYALDVADAALTVAAPSANTTGDGAGADTFAWQIDSGSWTPGISITGGIQNLTYGMAVTFAELFGHTLGDLWAVTVMTPARLNFCSLGNDLIYKNVAGTLKALDGGDMITDIPATLVRASGSWILNNPSLPVLAAIKPARPRKELTSEYTVLKTDESTELSCYGTFAVNFPACSTIPNTFYWIKRWGPVGGIIAITANGSEKIFGPGDTVGSSIFYLTDDLDSVQVECNGVNLHILAVGVRARSAPIEYVSLTAPTAPTLVENVTAGLVTIGWHSAKVTFVTALGEGPPSPASTPAYAAGSKQLDFSNIELGPAGTTARKVYLNKAGGSTWYLVGTLSDNSSTTLPGISIADATLGTGIYVAIPTTGGSQFLHTWPPGAVRATILAVGAGGSGGADAAGGGGGSGGSKIVDVTVVPGTTDTVTLGIGGAAGVLSDGNDGTDTSVGTKVTAPGGKKGLVGNTGGLAGDLSGEDGGAGNGGPGKGGVNRLAQNYGDYGRGTDAHVNVTDPGTDGYVKIEY